MSSDANAVAFADSNDIAMEIEDENAVDKHDYAYDVDSRSVRISGISLQTPKEVIYSTLQSFSEGKLVC